VEVAGLADTTLVLLAPGMGDAVQVAKAGLLEVGDVYVVNKADREGADRLGRDLRHMLGLGERPEGAWRPPIVRTVAPSGDGIDALVEAIAQHRDHLRDSGELTARRTRRAGEEIEALALVDLRKRLDLLPHDRRVDALATRVLAGELDPYTAADELVAEVVGDDTGSMRSRGPASP
jgi:LAO/AO transport system kinase